MTFQFPRSAAAARRAAVDAAAPAADRTYEDLKKERDARLDASRSLFDEARAYAKAAGPNRPRDWRSRRSCPIVEAAAADLTRVATEQEIRDAVAFADASSVRIVIAAPQPRRSWSRRSSRRRTSR